MVAYDPGRGRWPALPGRDHGDRDGHPAGVELVELPTIDSAATLVHDGVMAEIGASYQRLGVWIEENGYRTDGTAREVYLVSHPEPQQNWVTELQMPVATG